MSHDAKSIELRNKQIVQAGLDKWAAGTGSLFDDLLPDAKWTIVGNAPVSKTYNSKQEFIDLVITPFNARMSKRFVPTKVRGLYADGDVVVAFFDGAGTALDGKPYENTYTWYLQMKDGKIVDVVAFFDTIESPISGRESHLRRSRRQAIRFLQHEDIPICRHPHCTRCGENDALINGPVFRFDLDPLV